MNPADIAVYCSLKMDKDYPAPEGFRLFKGGDKDYGDFINGDFQHVIFNLSLQEGWDDPYCYFAYVDKSMESTVQVQQVIGRVLRQPGAKHYSAARLNTAHFYVRVDTGHVFSQIIDSVANDLKSHAPDLRFVVALPGAQRPTEIVPKIDAFVPSTALDPSAAVRPVGTLLERMTDYTNDDGTNTKGAGSRAVVKRLVGYSSDSQPQWETFEQSNQVMVRWAFQRAVKQRHPGALGIAPTSAPKFDALIGLGSNAEAHVNDVAERVVDSFLEHVKLIQKNLNPYKVGPQLVQAEQMIRFEHAIHEGYDDLNNFERDFATALDATGVSWCRNPARTGYRIPLPSLGPTSYFYPDFIVWNNERITVVDTKGEHLLPEAAMRKLLWIESVGFPEQRLRVKLVSVGRWRVDATQISSDGYTAWGVEPSAGRTAVHYETLEQLLDSVLE